MRIAYLDCISGIAGDMLLGALIDAGADLEAVQAGVASLGLPHLQITTIEVKRNGFRALKVEIAHQQEHKHRHLRDIVELIDNGNLSGRAKDLSKRVFQRLGEAEAKVHGVDIQKVHFHEVGAVDSIADIVGNAIAIDLLGIERIQSSPVPTGCGTITIAHGRCSIPAPATAELLKGIPIASSSIEAELTTPTGAAFLATLAEEFGPLPTMTVQRIGYGAGTKQLDEQPNVLRVMLGEVADTPSNVQTETVCLLETNIDNTTGELIGHCAQRLYEAGALDVYTTAIQMKKDRPGVILTAICTPALADQLESIIFRETWTLGVRRSLVTRRKLAREHTSVVTPWGNVDGVIAHLSDGQQRFSPEYESCRKVAAKAQVSLQAVLNAAMHSGRDLPTHR